MAEAADDEQSLTAIRAKDSTVLGLPKKNRHRLPPGPKGLPLVGSLFDFRRDPLAFLTGLARDYGDIVRFQIGSQDVVQINHPELIRDVLVTHSRSFRKTGVLQRARPVLGNGLVTSDGDFHRRQRRLMQPAMNRQRVALYSGAITEASLTLQRRWQHGQSVDIAHEMLHLTLAIVTQALFSRDVTEEADELEEAIDIVLEHFNDALVSPKSRLLSRAGFGRNRFEAAQSRLDRFVYEMIEERRRSRSDSGDVLSMLLLAQDEEGGGAKMSDEQVRDEVMTLLTAGHETVATALAWTWYCLSQSDDVRRRLEEEIETVLGNRVPTADDMQHLPYTEMVFAEAMRLYPPVWGMTRCAVEEYRIGDYLLPAGTVIGMTQYVMHRDPRFHSSPDVFEPLRWTAEEKGKRPKYSYFPFGGGPRLCIGEPFAWLEGVLVIATLAQRWRMRAVPEHPIEFQPLLTLRPQHGIKVLLEERAAPNCPVDEMATVA